MLWTVGWSNRMHFFTSKTDSCQLWTDDQFALSYNCIFNASVHRIWCQYFIQPFFSLLSCERCFHEQRLIKFDLYTKVNIDHVQFNTNYTRAELQLLTSVAHFISNAQRVFSDDATIQLLNLKIFGKERNPWLNNKLFEKKTPNLWTKREQLLDCLFSWQLMKILLQFSLWNLLSW